MFSLMILLYDYSWHHAIFTDLALVSKNIEGSTTFQQGSAIFLSVKKSIEFSWKTLAQGFQRSHDENILENFIRVTLCFLKLVFSTITHWQWQSGQKFCNIPWREKGYTPLSVLLSTPLQLVAMGSYATRRNRTVIIALHSLFIPSLFIWPNFC